MSFVKSLPTEKLGTWAATSMGESFKDVAFAPEWGDVLRAWSEKSQNAALKTAASGVIAVRTKK